MPLFCSQQLAERIERDETAKMAAAVAVALRRDPGADAFAAPLAGGAALWGGPQSPLNKIAGLGFGGVPELAELEQIEAAYRERGAARRVELASLADPAVGKLLTGRGYLLTGYENVLGIALANAAEAPPGEVEIRAAGEGEAGLWLDTAVEGFAAPDEQGVGEDEEFPREVLARVIGDLVAGGGYTLYLARIGGEVAGAASLRIGESIAQMSGAATLPDFRRRGVQSALVARRLADAAAAGCELATVTTQPGSKSQENVQRRGFHLLYVRAVLIAGEE